ncbi:MAG: FtsW/RodA/SpoVE family cell cycle protein [Actinomycetota bacterium]|nr:FtsW/RodA/SpoVE family cell cycle protein [Actinomycetota bacterium]
MTATAGRGTHLLRAEPALAKLASIDWVLVIVSVVLAGVGLAAINSATQAAPDGTAFVVKQLVFLLAGLASMFFLAFIDYREWRNFLGLLVLAAVLMLLLVLSPLGTEVKGTKGWFQFGFVSLQPAEFTKLAVIVTLAAVFTGRHASAEAPRIAGGLILLAVFCALVLAQRETGSVLVYCFTALGIFLVAGVPIRVLLLLIASAVVVFGLAFTSGVLPAYQKDRLTTFVDPDADPRGDGYNQRQSVTAIGSGGLYGRGYLEGPQTQLGFLPEQQTDFIFASVGEENGFVGGVTIIVLEGMVLLRVFRNGQLARDGFGTLICVGVFTYLTFQTFQNVAMTVRLMPITGVPLPFVSAGGSSLLTTFAALGLVQSIAVHRHRGSPT